MHDITSLKTILQKTQNVKILCVGDIMLDHFSYGTVSRISPEAPVPVLNIHRKSQTLGGAGNVLRNLATLGVQSYFCGIVGSDAEASLIENEVNQLKGVESLLVVEENRQTTVKTRLIASGQQMIRADQEETTDILPISQQAIQEFVESKIQEMDAVILSDYGKGVLTNTLLRALIDISRAHNIPVIIDPKGKDYSIYRHATVITPNLSELEQASKHSVKTEDDIIQAARTIQSQCQIDSILVTRSEKGMTLLDQQKAPEHIPTRALEVYDVSGAGDTVVMVLASALATGAAFNEACALANIAAGIVVGKIGTATVNHDELNTALDKSAAHPSNQFNTSWDNALAKIIEWHQKGYRVGFTNGCYDILHAGHISILNDAKEQCDKLIVGLNSDDSIKRLKGDARPINSEKARTTVLSSLQSVDLVTIFDQDTPLELIKHLKPDVLVKGADYKLEDVIGAQEVISWGGSVYLAELVPGESTTSKIEKLTG